MHFWIRLAQLFQLVQLVRIIYSKMCVIQNDDVSRFENQTDLKCRRYGMRLMGS